MIAGLDSTPWLALEDAADLPVLDADSLAQQGPAAVHPELAALALPAAQARGHVALHAGAVIGRLGVWGVIGTNRAGKTTLLWSCDQLGLSVATDDVLIVKDGLAYAGPRCLDLREPVAGAVPLRGDRFRVTLEPIPAQAPLRGFVHLTWGEHGARPSVRELSVSERLQRLLDPGRKDLPWQTALSVFELAALPGWELMRPRDGRATDSVQALFPVLDT